MITLIQDSEILMLYYRDSLLTLEIYFEFGVPRATHYTVSF